MTILPAGEYLPDMAAFNNPGASVISNVYPRTQSSYGPVGSLSPAIATGLTARCQGAKGFRDSSGNGYDFAGDATKLYLLTSSLSAWSNVSGSTYTIPADEQWRFAQFGNVVIACNPSDDMQAYTLGGGGSFATLSANAPKARYSGVVKGFFVAGNTVDSVSGAAPQRVWWSAVNDPTNWPTPGSAAAVAVQSSYNDIQGDQGWLTGIVPNIGPCDALLLFERAIWRMMYIGAPDVFGFYPMASVRGCAAGGSVAATETGVIYLGPDDFYFNDGINAYALGFQKIASYFYANVNQTFLSYISAAVDPLTKTYWLAYPSNNSGTGVPDSLLICGYDLKSAIGTNGRWAPASLSMEYIFKSVSLGYNEETIGNTGYNTDTAPFGPDSRVWTGAALETLTAFDTNHIMNFFNGTNLAPIVETGEKQLIPGQRARVTNALPLIDGGTPSVTPYTRNRTEDATVAGSASSMNADGYCPLNSEGRYHRFRLTMSSGSTFTHIQGVDIPDDAVTPAGTR